MELIVDVDLLYSCIRTLLWAFWILCTLAAAVTALDAPVPQAFKAAVRLSAARGKTWDSKPAALGWLRDASVPHKWFWHFYLVGVVANLAALALVLASALTSSAASEPDVAVEVSSAAVVSVVLLTHLFRRLAETLLVMRFPAGARMHALAYVYGLAYYAVLSITFLPPRLLRAALSLLLSGGGPSATTTALPTHAIDGREAPISPGALAEECVARDVCAAGDGGCGVEGAGVAAAAGAAGAVAEGALRALASDRVLLLGTAIALAGQVLQGHSHLLLASLAPKPRPDTHAPHASDAPAEPAPANAAQPALRRRGTAEASADAAAGAAARPAGGSGAASAHYVVPRGGAFEWVSCPHYLGEIVIYCGFWVALRGSPMAGLVLAWVVVNLIVGAAEAQRWYRATFPLYPAHRRALFPLLW